MNEIVKFLQTNAVTGARYDYSIIEKRLIYHTLMQIEQIVKNGVTDAFFERELDILIPEALLSKYDNADNRFRDYRKAVVSLRKKDFSIDLPDESWIETGFLARGKYVKNKGLEVSISRDLLPYLYDLSKRFTILEATVLMALQSKYSQRFYELCCQWRSVGKFEFTPQKLNDVLCLKLQTASLKERVIEVAQTELMQMYEQGISDIYFTYTEDRSGRGRGGSIKKFTFKIHTKKKNKERELATNLDYQFVVTFLLTMFDEKTAEIAMTRLTKHEDLREFALRVEKLKSSPKWSQVVNKAGYIRSILQHEYGMDE